MTTISNSVIFTTIIVCLFTTIFPIVAIIIFIIKKKLSPIPFLVGMGAFFVSQIVLRLPIMSVLAQVSWYKNFVGTTIGIIIVGGLTAGLFEETARYISARFILKNKRTYKDTISFGLGHGICEVIILVGLSMISNFVLMLMINSGSISSITSSLPAETAEQIVNSLVGVTVSSLLLSLVERVSAVAFHVFATVLIFKGVREKKIIYYFLAILAHTALNSVIVIKNIYIFLFG